MLDFDNLVVKADKGVEHIDDYYELLSSHKDALSISIPLLSINSMDDPVIDPNHIPLDDIMQNPNIIQLMVAGGGHIEYFHGLSREFVSLC